MVENIVGEGEVKKGRKGRRGQVHCEVVCDRFFESSLVMARIEYDGIDSKLMESILVDLLDAVPLEHGVDPTRQLGTNLLLPESSIELGDSPRDVVNGRRAGRGEDTCKVGDAVQVGEADLVSYHVGVGRGELRFQPFDEGTEVGPGLGRRGDEPCAICSVVESQQCVVVLKVLSSVPIPVSLVNIAATHPDLEFVEFGQPRILISLVILLLVPQQRLLPPPQKPTGSSSTFGIPLRMVPEAHSQEVGIRLVLVQHFDNVVLSIIALYCRRGEGGRLMRRGESRRVEELTDGDGRRQGLELGREVGRDGVFVGCDQRGDSSLGRDCPQCIPISSCRYRYAPVDSLLRNAGEKFSPAPRLTSRFSSCDSPNPFSRAVKTGTALQTDPGVKW
jgi:hypothetical protein